MRDVHAERAYRLAHNEAAALATASGRAVQIKASRAYPGEVTYSVMLARLPAERWGRDGEGEFIEPGAPLMAVVDEPPTPSFAAVVDVLADHCPLPAEVPAWLRDIVNGYGARRDAEREIT